jgi:heme-degrading monooxygenase HmoA
MIARIWRGRTPDHLATEYLAILERTGLPEYRATEGNLGVLVLQRTENGVAEFTIVTLWASMEAIRRFAGDDPEQAKYYPEDADYLLEQGPHVEHHEVVWSALDLPAGG